MILKREFYERDTADVAKALLGKVLVSTVGGHRTSGIIVETEAYLPTGDSACHAAKHRTKRTEIMFGEAGFAYVYPIHAKHCFNVVTESKEKGCAVLIRALQPKTGIPQMVERRAVDDRRRLTTGPACLCQALGIERSQSGLDLTTRKRIWIEEPKSMPAAKIKCSVRIGVTSAENRQLRFYLAENPFVSGTKRMRI